MILQLLRTALAAIAVYLEFSLPVTEEVFIPHFFALILILTLLPEGLRWKGILLTIGASFLFVIFNQLTTVNDLHEVDMQYKSQVYFLYVVGLGSVLMSAPSFPGVFIRRTGFLFLILGFGILIYGFLENSTLLGSISDAFREKVYVHFVYENDLRDIAMTGAVRPKVFQQGPSYAARGTAELLLLGSLALDGWLPRMAALLGICLAAVVFGSPIPLAFATCLAVAGFMPFSWTRGKWFYVYMAGAGIFSILLLMLLVQFVPSMHERFQKIADIQDESAYMRTLFMAEMAGKALQQNPLSGVGLGGQEKMAGDFVGNSQQHAAINAMINNALFSIPFFTGLSGCVFFLGLFYLATRHLVLLNRILMILYSISVMFCTGSISSSSVWVSAPLLIAILRQKESELCSTDEEAEPERGGKKSV